ncbi:MAG: YabP/YqfC family sporulation protein [Bacilli bacterium]|nr:YabP/YqfC family sporulation protein [Bacilli bacterium]
MLIYNHNKIMIKDYLSIRFMDCSYMCIELKEYDITIRGNDFEIEYLDNSELMVKGIIKVIECHETRV